MPHVKRAAGIGEHLQAIKLWFVPAAFRVETTLFLPFALPLWLDISEIIPHEYSPPSDPLISVMKTWTQPLDFPT